MPRIAPNCHPPAPAACGHSRPPLAGSACSIQFNDVDGKPCDARSCSVHGAIDYERLQPAAVFIRLPQVPPAQISKHRSDSACGQHTQMWAAARQRLQLAVALVHLVTYSAGAGTSSVHRRRSCRVGMSLAFGRVLGAERWRSGLLPRTGSAWPSRKEAVERAINDCVASDSTAYAAVPFRMCRSVGGQRLTEPATLHPVASLLSPKWGTSAACTIPQYCWLHGAACDGRLQMLEEIAGSTRGVSSCRAGDWCHRDHRSRGQQESEESHWAKTHL